MSRTLAIAITLALAAPALAQTPAPDPKACAPGERMPPQQDGTTGRAPPEAQNGKSENLTDKLARTDGVICPPEVGNDMRLPTPDTGRTPVIPPPGSPGGDPSIQPK